MLRVRCYILIVLMTMLGALFLAMSAQAAAPPEKFDHFATGFPLIGAHVDAACESCHVRGVMKNTPRACANCHNNVLTQGKGANHVSTNAPCDACHSPRSVTFDIVGMFDHVGIRTGCGTCHQQDRPANHIPTPPGADCDLCHHVPPAPFSVAPAFNHSNVTMQRCDACHSGAFTAAGAGGKTPDHPRTTPGEDCHVCHDTATFAGAGFDHTNITTGCNTCHLKDRPATHIPTPAGAECVLCHRVSPEPWTQAALFNHNNVTSMRCDACHSGVFSAFGAIGKTPDHPPVAAGQDCGDCHGTTTFIGAGFNHAGVTTGCLRCHASDLPTVHIPRPAASECMLCHRVPPPDSFAVALMFNHNQVTSLSCGQCHSGQFALAGAEGKGPGHFVTTAECSRCHTTVPGWTANTATFRHQSANYPGDHNPGVTCTSCHTSNSEAATWTNAALKPFCASCHERDYDAGPHDKTLSPATQYTAAELKDCSGACHVYATPGGAIARTRNGPEHRVNGGGF